MPETDLILMSLVIFTPSAFALALLFFPARAAEAIRWWALFGAAVTLVLSMCVLIDYYGLLDSYSDRSVRSLHHPKTTLESRADEAASRAAAPIPEPRRAHDWVARVPWIERFNIQYAVGIDGISMPLVLLTTVVTFLSVLASWNINRQVRGYFALLLILETGVLGAFMALDFFLFYVFYEVMLLPMYFLIGLWGGGRRKYAAIKFVIYTLFGSVLILIAMIGLYFADVRDFVDQEVVTARAEEIRKEDPSLTMAEARSRVEVHTFDIVTLQRAGQAAALVLSGQADRLAPRRSADVLGPEEDAEKVRLLGVGADLASAKERFGQPFFTEQFQYTIFLLLFVGFAVKVPIFPLHSWLPDAHVEAPTPISMILAGILLKLGGYGIIRLAYPICPFAAEQLAFWLGLAGAVSIIYGALVAMGQTDFKKLLAYSSVSHMGYVILGIAAWSAGSRSQYWAWGMNGAMFQMVAHGISSAALFFVVGVVYERAHHRDLNRLGGIMEPMPLYGGLSAILFFASMGLPGLCGFVGEVFVMLSAWNFSPGLALAAILTTILTAGYLLWTWQRVYLGVNPATANFKELSLREALVLLPFAALAILLGCYPSLLLSWMEPSVTGLVESLARLRP